MLRKPTLMFRSTLTATPMVIVAPEADAHPDDVRRVTLMIHEENQIYLSLDCDPNSIDARDGYWVEPTLGHPLKFEIYANQSVVGRAIAELHELGVIVEHIREGSGG